MHHTGSVAPVPEVGGLLVTPEERDRLDRLTREGWAIFHRFDHEVRTSRWHPFIASDYDRVLEALLPLRAPGARFLEWGSATGVITVMADILGFDACGIELDADLVRTSRELALRFGSRARFAEGSFVPAGYRWRPGRAGGRRPSIPDVPPGYAALGHLLDDFDVVFAFPWDGEEPFMLDVMRSWGRPGGLLLLHSVDGGTRVFRDGRRV